MSPWRGLLESETPREEALTNTDTDTGGGTSPHVFTTVVGHDEHGVVDACGGESQGMLSVYEPRPLVIGHRSTS